MSLNADNEPGLEIGFHVPPFSRGHVIARLGRDADLILPESYSGIHIAFEMHPETHVIMLSVRTKHQNSVFITRDPLDGPAQPGNQAQETVVVEGDVLLRYGRAASLTIASYEFTVSWRRLSGTDPVGLLRQLAVREYQDSEERLKYIKPRDRSLIDPAATAKSWYMTRLQSTKTPRVAEDADTRIRLGNGSYGNVFKALDCWSGNYFAVKVIDMAKHQNSEYIRQSIHREVRALENAKHVCIPHPPNSLL